MDHYNLLGLNRDCSADDIKNAFKRLAIKCHPDKPTGNRETFAALELAYKVMNDMGIHGLGENISFEGTDATVEQVLEELQVVFQTLSEPSSRAAYDNELANASKLQNPVWQTVTLLDMDLDDNSYCMDCRCGATLQVGKASTVNLPVLIECDDCSTMVRIDPVDSR